MARPALCIDVFAKDQKALRRLASGGVQRARVVLRALALLQLAKGAAAPRIAGMIPRHHRAIRNTARRYQQGGLDRALYEKPRPGAAEVLDEGQKQRLIAMVCSSPPEGRARWTVRLVAEEAVKRKLVPQRRKPVMLGSLSVEGPRLAGSTLAARVRTPFTAASRPESRNSQSRESDVVLAGNQR